MKFISFSAKETVFHVFGSHVVYHLHAITIAIAIVTDDTANLNEQMTTLSMLYDRRTLQVLVEEINGQGEFDLMKWNELEMITSAR